MPQTSVFEISEYCAVNDTVSSKVAGQNWRNRQRLKLALSLGLRRQIFIAVCDNLRLKDEIVRELDKELGQPSTPEQIRIQGYPKLVTLNVDLHNPNLLLQIAQWLKQHPLPPSTGNQSQVQTAPPSFQFRGVELLTGQAAEVQQSFLRNLLAIERHLPQLESNLLLWMPRSWLHLIRQSVPEFWRWHTSVFWFHRDSPAIAATGEFFQERAASNVDNFASGGFAVSETEVSRTSAQTDTQMRHYEHPEARNGFAVTKVATEDTEVVQGEYFHVNQSVTPVDAELAEPGLEHIYSLEEIAQLQKQSAPPAFIGEAYLQLGNYHRDRVAEGDKSTANLTTAIEAYTLSLQWLEESDSRVPEVLNDKGNLYWMLSRQPTLQSEASLYLEQAVESYQQARQKLLPEVEPQTYAMVQNNLGAAYNDLSRYQDAAENLQAAIAAYREALTYRTAEKDSHKYASTQNNLGTAYWHLAQQQEPIVNLKASVEAYQEALAQYLPEQDPLNWAMIQNNLGTAYWNLAQYQEPENYLQLAIDAYKGSLQYRTQDLDPIACAATENNLGTTYWHLGVKYTAEPQQQQDYFQQAIAAYDIAITIAERLSLINPPIPVNFDVVAAKNNLGLVHYQLATNEQFELDETHKSNHLEAALQAHVQALPEAVPESESYKNTFSYIVRTIKVFYQQKGIDGQNHALSQVPGDLLPQILPLL